MTKYFRLSAFALSAILLVGCSTMQGPRTDTPDSNASTTDNMRAAAADATQQTRAGLGEAALAPLEDLNLRKVEIPPLLAAIESPYAISQTLSCDLIGLEVARLDVVLGPDWDTPNPDERLRTEKLGDAAAEAALDSVAGTARSVIPFRGLVRQATGADSHQKRYNRAFKLGAQRRAYLKGMGLARQCDPPARPLFLLPELPEVSDEIIFKGDAPKR